MLDSNLLSWGSIDWLIASLMAGVAWNIACVSLEHSNFPFLIFITHLAQLEIYSLSMGFWGFGVLGFWGYWGC